MADVREKVEQIRQAVYGKEVRESIASGIEAINTDIDALNDLVDALDSRVDTIITTPISGEAATQEIVDARVSAVKSKTFATLDARFEETEQEAAAHMAEKATDANGVHGLKIEEGIWTPIIRGNSTYGANTYLVNKGTYIKHNKLVMLTFHVELSTKDPSMAGAIALAGLPFTPKTGTFNAATIGYISKIDLSTGYSMVHLLNLGSSLNIEFYQDGDNIATANINAPAIGNDFNIYGTIIYQTE